MSDDAMTPGIAQPPPMEGGTTYKVGYGRPPKAMQFKPGQSGNPRGRRKGARNVRTVVQNELLGRIVVRIDGKPRTLTKLEALVKKLVADALQGDPKAQAKVMELGQKFNVGVDEEGGQQPASQEDAAIIERFFARRLNEERGDGHGL